MKNIFRKKEKQLNVDGVLINPELLGIRQQDPRDPKIIIRNSRKRIHRLSRHRDELYDTTNHLEKYTEHLVNGIIHKHLVERLFLVKCVFNEYSELTEVRISRDNFMSFSINRETCIANKCNNLYYNVLSREENEAFYEIFKEIIELELFDM